MKLGYQQLLEVYLFSILSNPSPRTNHPPCQWVWVFFYRGQSGRGVMLSTYFCLVPKLRMTDSINILSVHDVRVKASKTLTFIKIVRISFVSLSLSLPLSSSQHTHTHTHIYIYI
jgi:hypothetical protein